MSAAALAPRIEPDECGWRHHFRIVASRFPPIGVFDDYVDADLLAAAFALESRTNDRLRAAAGQLGLIAREDYMLGPGATPVMAAFTHIGRPSRFSDGAYGVYYAAESIETALAEVRFHRERFLRLTREPPNRFTVRAYSGRLQRPLHDIRADRYRPYQSPDIATYPACQCFASRIRAAQSWGLLYRSARRHAGECVALLRPPAVGIPHQGKHYLLHWDGERIATTYEFRHLPAGTARPS